MTTLSFKLRISSRDTPSVFHLLDKLPADRLRRNLILTSWVQRGIDRMSIGAVNMQSAPDSTPSVRQLRLTITEEHNTDLFRYFTQHPNKAQSNWVLFYLQLGATEIQDEQLYLPPTTSTTQGPDVATPVSQKISAAGAPSPSPQDKLPADGSISAEIYPPNQEIDEDDIAALFPS